MLALVGQGAVGRQVPITEPVDDSFDALLESLKNASPERISEAGKQLLDEMDPNAKDLLNELWELYEATEEGQVNAGEPEETTKDIRQKNATKALEQLIEKYFGNPATGRDFEVNNFGKKLDSAVRTIAYIHHLFTNIEKESKRELNLTGDNMIVKWREADELAGQLWKIRPYVFVSSHVKVVLDNPLGSAKSYLSALMSGNSGSDKSD